MWLSWGFDNTYYSIVDRYISTVFIIFCVVSIFFVIFIFCVIQSSFLGCGFSRYYRRKLLSNLKPK